MPRINLTDRFVAHAKPDASGRTDYFDEGTPGLTLRVSDGGRKAWSFLFTSPKDGKRARATFGSYPGTSLAGARARAIEAKAYLDESPPRDPRDVFTAKDAGAMTVAMLAENYLEKHVRPNLKSAANIEQRLRKNVLPVIGAVRLADLHRRDINAVIDRIITRKAPTEGNRVFEVTRSMVNWARGRGDLDHNPIDGMAKPAAENGARERFLSDDEIRHLWRVLPAALTQSKACQRIVKLCLITGQRVGEVAGMRADELDLKKQIWSLPGSRVKNGHAHTVPLSRLAIEVIEEALADASDEPVFMFPSGDKAIAAHAVAKTICRALKPIKDHPKGRFGMAPWSAHSLRHTVLTGMAALGVQPIVIGSVANHLSVTKASVTFAVYVHFAYEKEKRAALDLWAERLAAIVAGGAAKVIPMQREGAEAAGA